MLNKFRSMAILVTIRIAALDVVIPLNLRFSHLVSDGCHSKDQSYVFILNSFKPQDHKEEGPGKEHLEVGCGDVHAQVKQK